MSRGRALVTGGGGAIAEEIARLLRGRGYDLTLADLDVERAAAVADRLRRDPGNPVEVIGCDLSTAAGIAELAAWVEAADDLTLLVNNAGYIQPGAVTDLTPDALDRHVMVNLVAPMQLTRAAGRAMAARGRGDVLSLVSTGGIVALRGSAAYSATKFGLRGFQQSVAAELAASGVRVLGVFPSGVDTPMLRHEATHPDGSALNFVGAVVCAPDVARACLRALDTGRLETYVPYGESLGSRLLGAFPWLLRRVEPLLTWLGERGRDQFLRAHGLVREPAPEQRLDPLQDSTPRSDW